MPCPAPSSLAALLDESLPAAEQAELTAHLDGCIDCRSRLETIAGGETLAPHDTDLNPPPALAPRMREVIARCKTIAPVTRYGGDASVSLDFFRPSEKKGCLGLFGSYEVLEVIGHGGMGLVLRAFDPALTRIVAIKVLLPGLAMGEEARQRFLREARTAAAIVHEHVVAIHAVGEERGLPYLVMQHVAGQSLAERIAEHGPLPIDEVQRLGRQIAEGLAAAHAKGVVHRDIKPGNILLDVHGRAKLTDFGLAKATDDASLTQSGVLAGTPEYMAPEQARGEPLDARADLFALGGVLYTMCTGQSPFAAPTTYGVIRRVCEEQLPPAQERRPEMPPWLSMLIERLLVKDPAGRLQTAAEAAQLLSDDPRAREGVVVPRGLWDMSRPWIIGLGLVSIVLWIAWGLMFGSGSPTPIAEPAPPAPPAIAAGPTNVTPPLPLGPFRIAGREASFESLAAAIEAAKDGDAIEIHGDGPFATLPIHLTGKTLTLRAAPGSKPKIVAAGSTAAGGTIQPLIDTDRSLTLIGLDLAWTGGKSPRLEVVADAMLVRSVIVSRGGTLTIDHCRIASDEGNGCVGVQGGDCTITHTLLTAPDGIVLRWHAVKSSRLRCEESILAARLAIGIWYERKLETEQSLDLRLARSTVVTPTLLKLLVVNDASQVAELTPGERWTFAMENNLLAVGSIFECQPVLPTNTPVRFVNRSSERLKQLLHWEDRGNVYSDTTAFVTFTRGGPGTVVASDLAAWRAFWKLDDDASHAAQATFAATSRREAKDFRIQKLDPAGEGAIPGADADAVGPK